MSVTPWQAKYRVRVETSLTPWQAKHGVRDETPNLSLRIWQWVAWWRLHDRLILSNGGMMISWEKPKKLLEKPASATQVHTKSRMKWPANEPHAPRWPSIFLYCSFRALSIVNSQHSVQQNTLCCSQVFILQYHFEHSYMVWDRNM